MSSRMPFYALDKVRTMITWPADVYIKIQNRAEEEGLNFNQMVNKMIFELVDGDPWTLDDQRKMDEIVMENSRKRDELKAKKGII